MTKKITLNSPVSVLHGVGPKIQNLLFHLEIEKVRDLLYYFPFRFDDLSNISKISEAKLDEKITILAKINSIKTNRSPYRKIAITEAILSDESGSILATWFNQPYLANTLIKGQPYRFSGKIKISKNRLFLQAPTFEKEEPQANLRSEDDSNLEIIEAGKENESTDTDNLNGKILPVYSVTKGLTPKMLRYYIKQALAFKDQLIDFLPQDIIKRQKLFKLKEAISKIHFPRDKKEIGQAKKRLAFDELFIFQLNYQLKKHEWQKNKAFGIKKNLDFVKKTVNSLKFKLTNDQRIAIWEIIQDLKKEMPMNRLLEGDVGSGKTVVAAVPSLNAAIQAYQVAFMAPTEILAKQHFEAFLKIAQNLEITITLLTNSMAYVAEKGKTQKLKKPDLIEKIKQGEIKLVIGTHAIIQKAVKFKNLSLVIIDEQHRFGVNQRAKLIKETAKIKDGSKKTTPHLLSMTATPIPRTLSLTIYGDLDLSIIKQMPKGRKKIITKIVPPNKRAAAYGFIRKQIEEGRQIFVICPLIEESEVLESKAAQVEYERLQNEIFPDLKIALLHGKLKSKDKEKIMQDFSQNKYSILVSTSVVEVGVDVANATIMMIEGAERFGLSQLHQFRGRVGRGEFQSYCFLFTDSPAPKTWQRLKFLEQTQNGFDLAQKDLQIRGPGEFLGQKQSGYSTFTLASLKDHALIKSVRQEAETLVQKDAALKQYPILKKKMDQISKRVHFE
jgi:ATP-dependent DNA helicase RecG